MTAPRTRRRGPSTLIPPLGDRPTVRDRLFEQRVVFLWGTLDDALASHLAASS